MTLCVAVYRLPQDVRQVLNLPCVQVLVTCIDLLGLLGLSHVSPVELGRVSYALDNWPGQATPVSFPFQYRTTNTTVPAGQRVGVRIWVSSESEDGIAVIYDHPDYQSRVELRSPHAP